MSSNTQRRTLAGDGSPRREIAVGLPPGFHKAVRGLAEICTSMLGLEVEPDGSVERFAADGLTHGATISMLHAGGSYELGLFGDSDGAIGVARAMLAMDETETPSREEVVDALGEVVNMVSGIVKRSLGTAELPLGVPLFLLGDDCRKVVPRRIDAFAQPFRADAIAGRILLVWSERTPGGVCEEIAATLEEANAADKHVLAHALALAQELSEGIGEAALDVVGGAIDGASALLMRLINEENLAADAALAWMVATFGALAGALRDGKLHQFAPEPAPKLEVLRPAAPAAEAVTRDPETIESIAEFLGESDEGLDGCDRILLAAEQGSASKDDVNALFRAFHSMKGLSSFLEMTEVTALAHTTETMLAKVRDGQLALAGPVLDLVFEAVEAMRRLLAGVRAATEASVKFPVTPALEDLFARLGAATRGEQVVGRRGGAEEAPEAAAEPAEAKKLKEAVKVDVELIERLGAVAARLGKSEADFSSARAALEEIARNDDRFRHALSELISGLSELREVSALMRMVSVSGMFQKMTRMVRDLSKKTGKLARLVLGGEETRIAREMVEKLNDPLVHMVRNAVDHGIEGEGDRRASGKPLLATIKLAAYHDERTVVVELSDDGRGLDPAKILAKATSKGLVPPGADLGLDQIYELLFAPGFSTAEQVTAISGRGVGMDVVKRNIESLGGKIVITSTVGAGTTFQIRLPLVA